MNNEQADARVELALRFHKGREFELVVGLTSVAAMVRALERAGLVARAELGTGRIFVTDGAARPRTPVEGESPNQAGCDAAFLLRSLCSRGYCRQDLFERVPATQEEFAHLYARRYDRILPQRLAEILDGLRRIDVDQSRA